MPSVRLVIAVLKSRIRFPLTELTGSTELDCTELLYSNRVKGRSEHLSHIVEGYTISLFRYVLILFEPVDSIHAHEPIAGLDTFGTVDCLFVVGRPLASPNAHRDRAVALTGKHPSTMEMAPLVDHILTRDGGGAPISRKSYVDELMWTPA